MALAIVSQVSPWGQVVGTERTLNGDVMDLQVYRGVEGHTAYIC